MIRANVSGREGEYEYTEKPDEIFQHLKNPRKTIWVDFENTNKEELSFLSKMGVHPLVLEDIISDRQRPKIENYDGFTYIVVRTLGGKNVKETVQLNLILGPNYVVTVNLKPVPALAETIDRVAKNHAILQKGADFVVYSIIDEIADDFLPVLNDLDEKIDSLEDQILVNSSNKTLAKLFEYKRTLLTLRRTIWPMRDILNILSRRDSPFISEKNAVYFRDVYDHVIRMTDIIESQREMMTSAMEAYLSVVSNNLNVVMKKLASIAAIIMVPTLIAGIYGMNFTYIPEAHAEWGFFEALGLMAFSALLLGVYFKWRDWL